MMRGCWHLNKRWSRHRGVFFLFELVLHSLLHQLAMNIVMADTPLRLLRPLGLICGWIFPLSNVLIVSKTPYRGMPYRKSGICMGVGCFAGSSLWCSGVLFTHLPHPAHSLAIGNIQIFLANLKPNHTFSRETEGWHLWDYNECLKSYCLSSQHNIEGRTENKTTIRHCASGWQSNPG